MKTTLIVQLMFIVVIGTGWIKNIIKLTECDFEPSYKAEVIHIIGIIPPIGMIVGWMDFGK